MLIPFAKPSVDRISLIRPRQRKHGVQPSDCIACGGVKCNDGTTWPVGGLGNSYLDARAYLLQTACPVVCSGHGGVLECAPLTYGCCGDFNYN